MYMWIAWVLLIIHNEVLFSEGSVELPCNEELSGMTWHWPTFSRLINLVLYDTALELEFNWGQASISCSEDSATLSWHIVPSEIFRYFQVQYQCYNSSYDPVRKQTHIKRLLFYCRYCCTLELTKFCACKLASCMKILCGIE